MRFTQTEAQKLEALQAENAALRAQLVASRTSARKQTDFIIEQTKGDPIRCATIEEWRDRFVSGINRAVRKDPITGTIRRNGKIMDILWRGGFEREVQAVRTAADEKISELIAED